LNESPVTLLLVEDDEDDYVVFRSLLGDMYPHRFHLDWAKTCDEARTALAAKRYSACILDHGLGESNGLSLLQEMRDGGYDSPIILLTGQSAYKTDIAAMQAGATDYLVKGRLDGELLERCLRYALERKRTEAAMRESEERFRCAFDYALSGMAMLGLEGEWQQVNQALCDMLGYPRDLLLTTTFLSVTHPDDCNLSLAALTQIKLGATSSMQFEKRFVHRSGRIIYAMVSAALVRSDSGQPVYISSQIQNITERKNWEMERERLLNAAIERADRDPITGLLNHRAFHSRFAEEADRSQRNGIPLGVLVMDLNNFKFFNDAYGHLAGDDVLRLIANALKTACRSYDILARHGGDEFAVLLPGASQDEVPQLKRRIEQAIANIEYCPPGQNVQVPLRISVGGAVLPDDGGARLDVFAAADVRLQDTKRGYSDGVAAQLRIAVSAHNKEFSMLNALVTAVDNKDRYTRSHSEDVLSFSLQIAKVLGMDEHTQHNIAVTALLHDVGKISVPDHILRKPGKLTVEEFDAIRQHPVMGAAIVGAVEGFHDTLDGIRYHHERWDGGGYPDGLKGEETPILARVIAVADGFSAMTTDRPYRKGMDEEQALAILESGAGTQWDSLCVNAFVAARRASPIAAHRLASPQPDQLAVTIF